MTLTTFDLESASRIAGVVRAVESEPQRTKPLVFDAVASPQQTKTFRVGSVDSAWLKGDDKVVTLLNQDKTVSATNLLYDVPDPQGAGSKVCAIAKEGTAWYFVNEESLCSGSKQANWLTTDGFDEGSSTQQAISGDGPQVLVNHNGCLKWIGLAKRNVVSDVISDGQRGITIQYKSVYVIDQTDQPTDAKIECNNLGSKLQAGILEVKNDLGNGSISIAGGEGCDPTINISIELNTVDC
jgi:hypothetical protein